MKKLTTILLALAVSMAIGFAQSAPKKMAVATFDIASNAVTKEDAEAITELYISELVNTGKVTVVDRANFDKLLKEMKFQASDWSDKEKTTKLGQAANAEIIARGQILKLGSKLYLSATAVDAKSAVILSASRKPFNNIDEIFNLLSPLADEVVKGVSHKVMKYSVGDTGPGGGIVFYVSEDGFDVFDGTGGVQKCNYLEVSKEEIAYIRWCPHNNGCSVTGAQGIGHGKANTYKIIQFHSGLTMSKCAAYACYNYSTSTTKKGDWFLPTKDELNLMCKNVGSIILAGASESWHWSSSPGKMDDCALGKNFSDGGQGDCSKHGNLCVRAVRAFSN